jgi:protein TonB
LKKLSGICRVADIVSKPFHWFAYIVLRILFYVLKKAYRLMGRTTNNDKQTKLVFRALPKPNYKFLVLALLLSGVVHLFSYISLKPFAGRQRDNIPLNDKKIKIKIVQKKTKARTKRIIETAQKETKAPEDPSYLGAKNHQTKKQTRVTKKQLNVVKAANPGTQYKKKSQKSNKKKKEKKPKKQRLSIAGGIVVPLPKPRNAYEKLLNNSFQEMQGEVDAGYQDFVDDKIADGDRIDLNTKEYRYIGYFTTLRKSIELVWNYPASAARKGLQGTVQLEFAIAADGTVSQIKVLNSSGYYILDRAIVEALKLASPFAPLPVGFGKKRIVITGAFNYVLQGYAAGH